MRKDFLGFVIRIILLLPLYNCYSQNKVEDDRIIVNIQKKGATLSPQMYGIFFEEINYAGDGGLYAELVQNRSFEDGHLPKGFSLRGNILVPPQVKYHLTGEVKKIDDRKMRWNPDPIRGWSLQAKYPTAANIKTTDEHPFFETAPHSLEVSIKDASEEIAVVNSGFWGMNIENKGTYFLRSIIRISPEYKGKVEARLIAENGRVLAVGEGKATITATTTDGTDLSHSVEVTVKPVIHVETFEMSSIHNKLAKGEISVLKYTVTPADATVSALVWTTSDATVASIEKRVLGEEEVFVILGGVNSGTATLTASITYADGSPGFEKSFEVSVVDGKINDDFLFTAGCFEGGDYGVLENGRLVRKIEKEANSKCEAQFRGTMTFYPSKYPIYAVKTFFEDSLDPAKTPTLLLNIWNNNPRISIGFYGGTAAGNAQNLYKVSMTRTSDGGYVTYADLSIPNIFKGANADFLTNGVLNDGITLDRCEHRFYDTYYTEAVTEPFALDWVKTFESLEAYKAYLIENEGVVFE